MWSSAIPVPRLSADCDAGTSSAAQDAGSAPSMCTRKPNRWVFWFDHITPTLPPGIAATAQMSSALVPLARVTGALQLL
jgi:hypothetical protein